MDSLLISNLHAEDIHVNTSANDFEIPITEKNIPMNLSFQKMFFVIATVFALFAIMILGRTVLIPLTFALLLSFILLPVSNRLESWGVNRLLAAFLSILFMFILLGAGIFLFSTQIVKLTEEFTDFQEKILNTLAELTYFINSNFNFVSDLGRGDLIDKMKEWFNDSAGSLVSQTFSGTSSFLTGLISVIIFTFLILIYRKGLTHSMSMFFSKENRPRAIGMFKSVQDVGKQYLFGMIIIMSILGVANSLGLWLIGIDNPILFGFLAATLAIVPYVGTAVGAGIPILYAFVAYDSLWMPFSVLILFWAIQVIESNFLSPKIVGGSLKLNALTAILSIIIGASVWGVAGMILFLPLSAMLKSVCEEYEELKPVALLIGDQNFIEDETEDGGSKKWLNKLKQKWSK